MKVPLDFKHFKKVASDEKSTTLMHPKGHKIMIAHSGLDRPTVQKLKELPMHLYRGGNGGDTTSDQADQEEQTQSDEGAAKNPNMPQGVNININAGQPQQNQMPQQLPQKAGPIAEPSVLPPPPVEAQAPQMPNVPGGNVPSNVPSPMPTPSQEGGSSGDWTPDSSGSTGDWSSPPANTPPTDVPKAPQDPYGMQQLTDTYMSGIDEQKRGMEAEAKATGDLGKARAGIIDKQLDPENPDGLMANYNKGKGQLADLDVERQHFINDIKNNHIDPNRLMNSKDLGGKLATAIGLIAGGIGGGLTHQENPAAKFLNAQIDRDIDAQRANLGKTQSLLAANTQQMGNVRDGMIMTKAMMNDVASMNLQKAADQAQDPIARARLLQEKGKLDFSTAQGIQSLKMQRAMMDKLSNPSQNGQGKLGEFIKMMRISNPKQAEEMSKRYDPSSDSLATIEIPDKSRLEMAARGDVDKKLGDLLKFSQANSGSMNPQITHRGETMAKDLQDAVRQANGQGVFREAEKDFMNSIISDNPTQFLAKFRSQPRYQQAKLDNLSSLNAMKKSYGLPVAQGKTQKEGW